MCYNKTKFLSAKNQLLKRGIIVGKILDKIRNSKFGELFHFRDELAKGRSSMILSAALVSVINWLTTGLFYTSFLDILIIAKKTTF